MCEFRLEFLSYIKKKNCDDSYFEVRSYFSRTYQSFTNMEAISQYFGNLIQNKDRCYSSLSTRNSEDSQKHTWIKGTNVNCKTLKQSSILLSRSFINWKAKKDLQSKPLELGEEERPNYSIRDGKGRGQPWPKHEPPGWHPAQPKEKYIN